MRKLLIVVFFLLAGTTATPAELILGRGVGYDAQSTHLNIDGTDSTVNYSSSLGDYVSSFSGSSRPAILIRWADSLNAIISGKTIDSAYLRVVLTGIERDNDSAYFIARPLVHWGYNTATFLNYATGSAWNTAGCNGAGTDYATTDSVQFTFGAFGDASWANDDTIRIPITDFVQVWADDTTDNEGLVIKGRGGYCVLGIYSADHTTAARRPEIQVYYSSGPVTVSPPASVSIDTLHSDFSDEEDSIEVTVTTGSQTGYDKVIIAWSTLVNPDSSNAGDTLEWAYQASHTFTDTIIVDDMEEYTAYINAWNYDATDGWSTRRSDTKVFRLAADTSPPDSFEVIRAFILDVDNTLDTVLFQLGAVDSTDFDGGGRTIIRYSPTLIPQDTTQGSLAYAANTNVENTTVTVGLNLANPTWVYFAAFALDEARNASDPTICSTYVADIPEGGSGSLWTQDQIDSVLGAIQATYDVLYDTVLVYVRDTITVYVDTSLFATVPEIWQDSLPVDTGEVGAWLTANLATAEAALSDADIAVIMDSILNLLPSDTSNGGLLSAILRLANTSLKPTTAGRTLDVTSGGAAGIDWANIEGPTTTVSLSGTTVGTVTAATLAAGQMTNIKDTINLKLDDDTTLVAFLRLAAAGGTDTWNNTQRDSVLGALSDAAKRLFAAQVSDTVWDELAAGHMTAGSFGDKINDSLDAKVSSAGSSASISDADKGDIIDSLLNRNIADTVSGKLVSRMLDRIQRTTDTVNGILDTLQLQDDWILQPTVAGRKLDVTTGGAAGIDWSNIENATSTVNLTGTTIDSVVDAALGGAQMTNIADSTADAVWGYLVRTVTGVTTGVTLLAGQQTAIAESTYTKFTSGTNENQFKADVTLLDSLAVFLNGKIGSRTKLFYHGDMDSLVCYTGETRRGKITYWHVGGTSGDAPDSVTVE